MSAPPTAVGRDLWADRVRRSPDRCFLRSGPASWTYGETDALVRRLAGGLRELGVGRGTRVLVGLSNRPETVQLHLALHQLGAVMVPLLGGLTAEELVFQARHSGAGVLVADEPVASTLAPRLGDCPRVDRVVLTRECAGALPGAAELEELLAHDPLPFAPLEGYGEHALLAILYTSGSTGRPKGVMLPTGSFHSCGAAFIDRFGIGPDDNYILPVPLAHAAGAFVAQSIALHAGARLTVVDRFSPSAFWDQVRDSGATVTILFPAHLNLLLETDSGRPARGESPLRLVITHAWNERFRERFGVELATVWGMTETGALCTGSAPGRRQPDGCVGTPMRGVEIRVTGDDGRPVAAGAPGEIQLRHPHVMLGYLDDPAATAETLAEGWVRSGDRGFLDAEGRLFFAGRLKNVIKRSGENVSAEEVEAALCAHPAVAECAVVGVPDRVRTEEVAALVVVRAGAGLPPAELLDACASRLARFKRPRYLLVTEEPLPRLGNGKIDRRAVSAAVRSGRAWDRERA